MEKLVTTGCNSCLFNHLQVPWFTIRRLMLSNGRYTESIIKGDQWRLASFSQMRQQTVRSNCRHHYPNHPLTSSRMSWKKSFYSLVQTNLLIWHHSIITCPATFSTIGSYHHLSSQIVHSTFYNTTVYHLNSSRSYTSTINMNNLVDNIFRRNSVSLASEKADDDSKPNLFDHIEMDYKTSIKLLNQLQSNSDTVQQAIIKEQSSNVCKSLEKTTYFLSLIGLELNDLNKLNVIHVAGTKGKGSTCAFVESILRNNGFRTGFYSSPHLVMACERIRINGRPITEDQFTHYFSYVYNQIRANKSEFVYMPAYFNFMTVMAFHVFLEEKVDVAIMEVGIGGEYDCTNVIQKPIVTGITSLDLDHCKLLGDRIEKIAWQKAGIFKPNVVAFTVKQCNEAMNVLRKRSVEKGCPLFVVPSWSIYPQCNSIRLGIQGEAQKTNASLAVQLAHYWMNKQNHPNHRVSTLVTTEGNFADIVPLNMNHYGSSLTRTKWFGRCEIINRNGVTYYLDSAHTQDSMRNCRDWFVEEAHVNEKDMKSSLFSKFHHSELKPYRILVFNCTRDRDPLPLLSNLENIPFDLAIFTTNQICGDLTKDVQSDVANFTVTIKQEMANRSNNAQSWKKINSKIESIQVACITEAIETIEAKALELETKQNRPVQVLVTGSVHLVGGFIGRIHPLFNGEINNQKL